MSQLPHCFGLGKTLDEAHGSVDDEVAESAGSAMQIEGISDLAVDPD